MQSFYFIIQGAEQKKYWCVPWSFTVPDKFCRENIPSIPFFTVFKADMIAICNRLYSKDSTVPGTHSCHYFEPLATNTVRTKQLSIEIDFLIHSHTFSIMPTTAKIQLTTLSDETLSGEIFVGRNYSLSEIFFTFNKIRHFQPTKFCPIRYTSK